MGAPEKKIINKILSELPDNKRLFRINAGRGWICGPREMIRVKKTMTITVHRGTLIMRNPRRFYGAPAGCSDLVGWETIEVTPEMVGQKIAVFTMEEVKAGRMQLSKIQKDVMNLILKMGGIFRIIRE